MFEQQLTKWNLIFFFAKMLRGFVICSNFFHDLQYLIKLKSKVIIESEKI